jgi:hypothetical protein
MARIPSVPWERASSASDVMTLTDRCFTGGYDSHDKLAALIAVYGLDWRAQTFPNYWSSRGLAVMALLEGADLTAVAEGRIAVPKLPFDVCRSLVKLAARWRVTAPTAAFWTECEAFQKRLAWAMRHIWPEPRLPGPLQRCCDILACAIKAQHAFDVLLEGHKAPCEPSPPEFVAWLDRQIVVGRQGQSERNPEIERLYMSAELYPGEEDRHAREANGVFSPSGHDVVETQRPNVAFDAVCERLGDFDTEGACGVLLLQPICSMVKKHCKFDWARNVLFVDFLLSSERQSLLQLRQNPWILLVCNTWFVRHPRSGKSYFSTDSRDAAYTWFKLFFLIDAEEEFFDGEDFYSMLSIPGSCPLSREAIVGDSDEEDY